MSGLGKRLLVFAAAAGALAGGCRRSSGPDPAFEAAHDAFARALAEQGDAAWHDARADAALAAAKKVPKDSIDRDAADELVARIEGERRDEAATRAKVADEARLVPDPSAASAFPSMPSTPAEAPDAGTAPAGPPVVGSSEAAFHQRYGACVHVLAPFTEQGGKRQGKAWGLLPGECEASHPELKGQAVAVLDGKVFNVVPVSTFHRDGPDGGTR